MSTSLAEHEMNKEKLSQPGTPNCSHVPRRHRQQVSAKINILAKPISEQRNPIQCESPIGSLLSNPNNTIT